MRRLLLAVSSLCITTLVAACGAEPTAANDARVPGPIGVQAAPSPANLRTIDQHFVDIAHRVPGFGGLYLDRDGIPTILLTDESRGREAAHAIRDVMGSIPNVTGRPFRVVRGRYGFNQLEAWRAAMADSLGARYPQALGITFHSVFERKNVVQFGVANAEARAAVATIANLVGVPDDALSVVDDRHRRPASELYDNNVRPVVGGLKLLLWQTTNYNYQTCSLGFNLTNYVDMYAITASHCTLTLGSVQGDTMAQSQTTNAIAIEEIDPAFTTLAGCPSGKTCRYSDAAAFRYINDSDAYRYGIAKTQWAAAPNSWGSNGSFTIDGTFESYASVPMSWLVEGQFHYKVGATTGWTRGRIMSDLEGDAFDGTCINTEYAYDSSKMFLCQYYSLAFGGPGDSGSPYFMIEGTTVYMMGIMHGVSNVPGVNYTVFSAWPWVIEEIGLTH